jgi:hypothetical protein
MKTLKQFVTESDDLKGALARIGAPKPAAADEPGIYSSHVTHGKGRKQVTKYHEVHARSHADAADVIARRHAEEHRLDPRSLYVRTTYHGPKKTEPAPAPKPPNKGSKEHAWREKMQADYDSRRGYKGD